MLINDLVSLLQDLPSILAGEWAAWLFVGLLLSVWQRRDSRRLVVHEPSPRQKSGVRAPARPVKKAPLSAAGDAFGELEALLEPPTGTHRRPGESPMLTDPARSQTAALVGPQSLP